MGSRALETNCATPKGSRNLFSASSARLRDGGRKKKKNDIPVVFCAAAHLEVQSFLLLHSAPVLGRNPAGFGVGEGAERFGVPERLQSFCVPSFDARRESRFLRDKKTFCSSRRRNHASPEVSRGLNIHSHIYPQRDRKNQSLQKVIPDFSSGKSSPARGSSCSEESE